MPSKPYLTLDDADRIALAARSAAQSAGAPVTICIVDDGGHPLRLDRMDGAPLLSLRVAQGKACTAVEMRMSTTTAEQVAVALPSIIAVPDLYPFRGGFPLLDGGFCLGGIGVSGGAPEQDEQIAQAAVRAWIPGGGSAV